MKKLTTKTNENKASFEQKLKSYSMAAAALLATQPALSAIIYTDVDPDISQTTTGEYLLDLNNDGITDFTIEFTIGTDARSARLLPTSGNEALGSLSGQWFYPFALNMNAPIASTQTVWNGTANGGYLTMAWVYTTGGAYGNWFGTTDKYLGLRFKVGSNWHYGWARLDINAACSEMIIKDYAYDNTPDAAINAGATGSVGMPNLMLPESIDVFAYDKVLTVDLKGNPVSHAELSLVSVNGQQVLNAKLNDERVEFSLSNLKPGLYLATIRSSEGTLTRRVFVE